jgi:hypothetical protein
MSISAPPARHSRVVVRFVRRRFAVNYMLLFYIEDRPDPRSPEGGPYYGALMDFHRHCSDRGVLIGAAPLAEPAQARTIRVRQGCVLATDGPFAETTEWLAGYFLLDCRDHEEALELAAACPVAQTGSVELRPIWDRSG